MNGVRAFAAYLGLVWFFLGFANLLTVLDRVKESLAEDASVTEAAELRLERAEKALAVVEKEWEAKLVLVDKRIEKWETEIERAEKDEDMVSQQLAEVELAREQAMRVGQEELMVKAKESAQNRIDEIEAAQISVMDWVRSVGGTFVGVLLVAFAWRGPPLRWEDVIEDGADAPRRSAAPAPAPAPAPSAHASADDDLELDIEDPSDVI